MEFLNVVNGRINAVIRLVLLAVFSVMVIAVFAQVVFRYALHIPLPWSEELARYTFIWATFLGASVAFYEGGHISVNMFVGRIRSPRGQATVMVLADFFCLWFLGMYVWEGFIVSHRIFMLGQMSPAFSSVPIGLIYLAIPIGSLFMGLNVLAHMLRHINTIRTGI